MRLSLKDREEISRGIWANERFVDIARRINRYEKTHFTYQFHGVCAGNARGIFSSKICCCSDYTAFSVYCLQKAGYEAGAIKVVSPTGKIYHVVCEYKDNGKLYIMDNSCVSCTPNGIGILEKEKYTNNHRQIGYGYQ